MFTLFSILWSLLSNSVFMADFDGILDLLISRLQQHDYNIYQ